MLRKKVISGKAGLEHELSSKVLGDLQSTLFDPLNVLDVENLNFSLL